MQVGYVSIAIRSGGVYAARRKFPKARLPGHKRRQRRLRAEIFQILARNPRLP